MTHYEVLGVQPGASSAEIRRSYVALAREHHPDFDGDERIMQRVNEAWQVLGDPGRRRDYDRSLLPPTQPGVVSPEFVPYDDEDDDYDPEAYLDDLDRAGTGRSVPGWVQMLPVVLMGTGAAGLIVGLLVNLAAFMALGVVLGVLGALGFMLTPMLTVLATHESDPDR